VRKKEYRESAMFGVKDGEKAAVGKVDVGDLVVDGLKGEDVDDTWSASVVVDGKEGGEVEVFVPRTDGEGL
jgi:hypothetical protein